MNELIIRLLQGKATEAEEKELRAWRQASPVNEEHYGEVTRVWALSGRAHPKASRRAPAAQDLIRRAGSRPTHTVPLQARTRRRRISSWTTRGVAAAALVVLGLGIGELWSPADRGVPALGAAEITTGVAELATVRLGDGSIVRLGPQSRLRVTGEGTDREVWFDGRAFFAVAQREGEPFRVRSRAGDALVLGTRFEIRVKEDDLRLAVVEGRVALSTGEAEVQVNAGEVSHAAGGAAPTVAEIEDVRSMLGWMGQFLVFQSTPLEQVARELEQHYDIRVRVVDEGVAQRTVTAWFTDESVEDVLMMICRVADVHCSLSDGLATIEP